MSDHIEDVDAVMQIIHSDDQVDISEVFSRPRLVPRCAAFHLIGGQSFDWKDDSEMDLAGVNGRATVWAHVNLYEPKVLMFSPPCTLYSQLTQLWGRKSMGETRYQSRRLEAGRLLSFSAELANHQRQHDRHFILEHPDGASSWEEDCLAALSTQPGVFLSRFDQCRFGLRCPYTQEPIRKRTRLVHNIPEVDAIFNNQFCLCEEPHRQIQGAEGGIQISSFCETYPPQMVDALLSGVQAAIGVQIVD